MDMWKNRISKLLTVKSIVTLVLTGVFAFMAVYFGTQTAKAESSKDGE